MGFAAVEMAQQQQNDKRTIYVGGLEEHVDEEIITSAFIPFGELSGVNIPIEQTTQKHRGFAFVTFELKADAKEAMENMNNSELFGRGLRVNIARPQRAKAEGSGKAVWADEFADGFFKDDFTAKDEKDGDIFEQAAMLPAVGEVTRDKRGNAKALLAILAQTSFLAMYFLDPAHFLKCFILCAATLLLIFLPCLAKRFWKKPIHSFAVTVPELSVPM